MLDPTVVINTLRTAEYASPHLLLRDASRDLPHSAIGKPMSEIADVFETQAVKHLSRGTSQSGNSPEHVNQRTLLRAIDVGKLPFRLESLVSAVNQPNSVVARCDVSLEFDESLDTSTFTDAVWPSTGTALDDVFKNGLFLERCRQYPEISRISLRFESIPHARQQYITKAFVVHITFRDDVAQTTASLTFRAESRLEPAIDHNGIPVDDLPFVESDTWLPIEKIGEGSGSWQMSG